MLTQASPHTAVIVGCLPTFKALFSRNAFSHPHSSKASTYHPNRASIVPLRSGEYSGTHTKIKAKGLNERWPSSDSTEGIITARDHLQMAPLQGDIRVQKDVVSLPSLTFGFGMGW